MTEQPIPDTRTCREKQDAAIADLDQQTALLTSVVEAVARENIDLRARVAKLELRDHDAALDHGAALAQLLTRVAKLEARFTGMYYTPADVIHPAAGTGALLAGALEQINGTPPYTDPTTITWYGAPPAVSVAGTPGTSWQPGGWVEQYAAAVDDA